jgi:hypothetical protein
MKNNVTLTVVSWSPPADPSPDPRHLLQAEGSLNFIPVVVFSVWLYATLMAPDRVWGYVIMLLGGLFGAGMIVVHANGTVVGKSGGFFFVWTTFALAATGWVTMILSARGLWLAFRARRPRSIRKANS